MPRSRSRTSRMPVLIACLVIVASVLAGCSAAPPPVLVALQQVERKTPVVYVPGSTGSKLRERATGELVWGEGRNVIVPHDDAYGLARPIGPAPSSAESRLEPTEAIREIRLAGIFGQKVYGPIVELLEANGYRLGDLGDPAAADTAFLFAYDWRLDHRIAAQRLLVQLEALRRARGEDRLEVDLICQSNGGYICRYLLKYGGATPEEAKGGAARPPEEIAARKVILLGNSNGGSLRMLREMHRGRGYVALVGRKMRPEAMFTMPALFQDLPVVRPDLFLDEAGKPLAVDIFDADAWLRHGWSIFAPEARRRIARRGAEDIFGDEERQMEHLRQVLDYARRFHQVLASDAAGWRDGVGYYMIQSRSEDTPDRAVLRQRDGRWEILFTGDKKLRRLKELHEMATAEGDEHGTVASQNRLSPQEEAALAAPTTYIDDNHFDLILRPETHRRLLEILAGPGARKTP
ncbi:MAG: hypothetical protein GY719_16425 [bacterium]|nr:hypothetical protein [bacterium]